MAITNMDALVNALATGQHMHARKASLTAQAAGKAHSMWAATGLPAPGALTLSGATNGVIPTQTLTGAAARFTNPTGGNTLYLGQWTVLMLGNNGTVTLYDRLFHAGSFAATTTSITITSPPALTRPDATGTDTELWVEVATATTTAGTITVTYTNSTGTGSRTATGSIPAATLAGQMIKCSLAAGDLGVKSIQSYTLSGTLTAGTLNLLIVKPVALLLISATSALTSSNPMVLGMPVVSSDACLMFSVVPNGGATGDIVSSMTFIQG